MKPFRSLALTLCALGVTFAASGCHKSGPFGTVILVITTSSLPDGAVGTAYNETLGATGGTGPYTWVILFGGLPNGLSLNGSTGVISGTPTGGGSSSFTVRVTDANSSVANRVLTIIVTGGAGAPSVSTTTLPNGTQNSPYNAGLSATGGVPPYTWAVIGSLPAGLALNTATGQITGTPTGTGTTNFQVTVTDSTPTTSAAQALSITVVAPVNITTTTLPDGTVGAAYSAPALVATGGVTPYNWSLAAGSLPAGLTLNASTGVISGTPTAAGSSTFTVQADGQQGGVDTQVLTISVNPAVQITTTTLAAWTEGHPGYSETLAATGGDGSYAWTPPSPAGGAPGLTLSGAGVLSGTPTTQGTYNFNVTATDGLGGADTQGLTVVVNPPVSITSGPTLSAHTANVAGYTETLNSTGGTGAHTWSAPVPGNLPTGLTLSAAGVISGTPTASGTFGFDVVATDTVGASALVNMSITINPIPTFVTTSPLPTGSTSVPYNQTITGQDGTGALTFTDDGNLPANLTLTTGGVLSGTLASTGTFMFDLTVTDSLGAFTTQTFSLTVVAGPAITGPAPTLTPWTEGVAYPNVTITATGGALPYTWTEQGSNIPTGMNFNPTNQIFGGTPAVGTAGTHMFTIRVTDNFGIFDERTFTLVINPDLTISSISAQSWTEQFAGFSVNPSAGATGTPALTWNVTGLPTGLVFSTTTGAISGTPGAGTSGGSPYSVNVSATDAAGDTDLVNFLLTINPPVTITSPPLPDWTQNFPYSPAVTSSGGTGAVTFSAGAGVPTGLTFNSNGTFTGSPTATGTFNFTVTATDSVGATAQQAQTVVINPALMITSSSTLPDGSQGSPYNFSFTSNGGGTGGQTFTEDGTLAGIGLTLAGDGTLTGTPTSGGTFPFVVTVTDGIGASANQNATLFVLAPLTITTPSLPNADAGVPTPYAQSIVASGGRTPYTWTLMGVLPNNFTFTDNTTSADIANAAPGPDNEQRSFTVRVTDADSRIFDKVFSLTVENGGTPLLTITVSILADGVEQFPYSSGYSVTGGTPPYTWSYVVPNNTLPTGLNLNGATGQVTGTPAAGTSASSPYTLDVRVTDSLLATDTVNGTQLIINPALNITTTTLPNGSATGTYNETLLATGGQGPYSWSLISGSLPPNLTLSSGGVINTGTTTTSGTFNFTVQALDQLGAFDQQALQIIVNQAPTVATTTLPDTTEGGTYSQMLMVNDGTAPYVWTAPDPTGNLPPNIAVAGNTLVNTGPVGAAGTYTFDVTVTDTNGAADTRTNLQITVLPPVSILSTSPLPNAGDGVPYSFTFTATGGDGNYTWNVTNGSPSAGITLSTAGVLSGTSSVLGTSNFDVTVTDGNGGSAVGNFDLTVVTGPTITLSNPFDNQMNVGLGSHMVITFSERMDTTLTEGAISLSPAPANPLQFFWNGAEDTVTVVFDTTAPVGIEADDLLVENTTYTVSVDTGATAHSSGTGLPLAAQVDLDFTTLTDVTGPGLDDVGNFPAIRTNIGEDPRTTVLTGSVVSITVYFDEDMDTTTGEARVDTGDQGYNAFVGFPSTEMSVTWITVRQFQITFLAAPLLPLPSDSVLELQLNQIRDASFNFLTENEEEFLLVTSAPNDGVAPTITGSGPSNGQTNVPRDTAVLVGLSEPMAPDIVSHVTLTNGGAGHPVFIEFSNEPLGIFVYPLRAWPASSTITINIDATAEDNTGVATGTILSTSFTTAAATAADAQPIVLDPPFNTLRDGDTDVDTSSFWSFFRFRNSSSNLRAYLDGSPTGISVDDISLTETATGIPIKGYEVFAEQALLFIETSGGGLNTFTGLQENTGYTLRLKSTFQSSMGIPLGSNVDIGFTTFNSAGGNRRPTIQDPPESEYEVVETFGAEAFLGVSVCDFDFITNVGGSAVDSPNAGFAPTLSTMFPGSCTFLRYESTGPEAALITTGQHTLTYTVNDGAGGHTYDIDSTTYRFPNNLGVNVIAQPDSTAQTRTFQWTGSAPAGATAMFLFIENDTTGEEVFFALLPITATSFTMPADRPLPSGETYLWTVAYVNFEDNVFTDEASQGFGIVFPDLFDVLP